MYMHSSTIQNTNPNLHIKIVFCIAFSLLTTETPPNSKKLPKEFEELLGILCPLASPGQIRCRKVSAEVSMEMRVGNLRANTCLV